jgi:exosortase/archaeosortase family protein
MVLTGLRPFVIAVATAAGAGLLLHLFPSLELACFARGAAQLAGLFTGMPVEPMAGGWLLPYADLPVGVTAACSATDFFLMLAALIAWQLARRGHHPGRVVAASFVIAAPLTIFLNSLRVVTVTQAHRWFIPLLPASYGPLLHLLAGAAIFLPSLILVSLCLEFHGRTRLPSRA